jgi:predicted adenine nucleotide alpha hydrolase (AANH) superfamily ATPase
VLTVSRLKSARMVNPIGKEEAARAGVAFVDADMGKNDGYNDSVRVTTRLGIYRQDYCGCRFSIRKVKSAAENAEE